MRRLRRLLLKWYSESGRDYLPWRRTHNPYRVLISEMMLQQTQVERVIPKYEAFVARFPDFESLANASTADVLRLWQGLGYNSRAVRLKALAELVVQRHRGSMPSGETELRALPGVGPYTVAAVRAFAFNIADAAIDTNVRRVVHRLLHGVEYPAAVPERTLDRDAHALVPRGRSHDWNSALMDLGSQICTARAPRCLICPLLQSCAAAPVDAAQLEAARIQSGAARSPQERLPFKETSRYARGRIVDRLRCLPPGQRISLLDLQREMTPHINTGTTFAGLIQALRNDGLLEADGESVCLKS